MHFTLLDHLDWDVQEKILFFCSSWVNRLWLLVIKLHLFLSLCSFPNWFYFHPILHVRCAVKGCWGESFSLFKACFLAYTHFYCISPEYQWRSARVLADQSCIHLQQKKKWSYEDNWKSDYLNLFSVNSTSPNTYWISLWFSFSNDK